MAITVKNTSTASVTIIAPDYNFRRELMPGRSIPLPQEVFDELSFDTGFQSMVSGGFIKISGVDTEGIFDAPKEDTEAIEIDTIIKERNVTKFAKLIPTATPAVKDAIVKSMVANNVTDAAFTALVNKYCGVDVLQAITIARQSEEPLQ